MTTSLRATIKRTWARLRGGELTPAKAALSVALGLLVGVTPLWGLHFWIVLGVGLFFRLDVPVAYLAANISIPPLLPFITIAEIEIGSWIRTGAFVGISRHALASRGAATYLKDVWVGTALLAPSLAAVGGAITYGIVRWKRGPNAARDHGHDAAHRVALRYKDAPFGVRMYVSSKLSSDPVSQALVAVGHEVGGLGEVVDVGCGRGQLALFLLESDVATVARGVDWDEAKVALANRAAEGLAASFAQGDVRSAEIGDADTVLLVDVLHYFSHDEQRAILARAATAAKKLLLVRDLDPDRGWRSTVTEWQERLTTGAKYNKGERVLPRSMKEISSELDTLGFDVEIRPCWGSTPFANVLVVAHRRGVTS